MRGSFGRYAVEQRLEKRMSPKEFSQVSGLSLSRISDLEHQRATVTDDVVSVYVRVLNCTGSEANEFRKRARTEKTARKMPSVSPETKPIQALMAEFGDRISPKAISEIQKIVERETGESVSALFFASNKRSASKTVRSKRPSLPLMRLVDIALEAERVRAKLVTDTQKLEIGYALEKLCHVESLFDYEIKDILPSQFDGAFAVIAGHKDGHTLLFEEERLLSALKGVFFARHVIAHEIGHHFLHGKTLSSEESFYMAPQQLAKNSSTTIESTASIKQVVDSIEEVEAECFATLFLVPWGAFFKGTDAIHLARDFGEQPREVERYMAFFKQEAVRNEIKRRLHAEGRLQHPIFLCD